MKKIFLIRHGCSAGNADFTAYLKQPDYSIHLTEEGFRQAEGVGETLSKVEGDFTCFVSNYHRAKQTLHTAAKKLVGKNVEEIESCLLREQEWCGALGLESSWENEKQRVKIGVFCYRFPGGESCADVFNRCKMFKHFDLIPKLESSENNIAIFAHGMTNRVMLMALLGLTVEEFEMMKNPKNCEIWELNYEGGAFKLITEVGKRKESLPFPYPSI